jgi:hypothetical protein
MMTISLPSATLSIADCTLAYVIKMKPTISSTFTTSLLPPFMHISSINVLTIYSSDSSMIASYDFEYSYYPIYGPLNIGSLTFKINIVDVCAAPLIDYDASTSVSTFYFNTD